ncbi:DNA polymerase III subunit delta' [Alphaproteobacteria bacterium]|nr:DNA polymerase III subunit delta' [Alphaproteobacteria bacterium]
MISPEENKYFIGHNNEKLKLLNSFNSNIHHSWIISGPKGVGKATLIYNFAKWILHNEINNKNKKIIGANNHNKNIDELFNVDEESSTFRQIANFSHPNLLTIKPIYDEKNKRLNNEILVDDIRKISSFFNKKSFNDNWRIVIIDSGDEMNKNSSNALLKALEEPPKKSIIFIISHHSQKLLATIKSRCVELKLKPLDKASFDIIINNMIEINEEDIVNLGAITDYRPGYAMQLLDLNIINYIENIVDILTKLPEIDYENISKIAQLVKSDKSYASLDIFGELIFNLLSRYITKNIYDDRTYNYSNKELKLIENHFYDGNISKWIDAWKSTRELLDKGKILNLDKGQIINNMFINLSKSATN